MMSITGTSRKKTSSQRTTKHGTRTVTQWTCDPLRTVHSLLIRLGSSLDSVFYLRVLCDGGRGEEVDAKRRKMARVAWRVVGRMVGW